MFSSELCFRVCTHSGKHYGFTRAFARINNQECQEMSSNLMMVHVTIAIADHSKMLFVIITLLLMGQNRKLKSGRVYNHPNFFNDYDSSNFTVMSHTGQHLHCIYLLETEKFQLVSSTYALCIQAESILYACTAQKVSCYLLWDKSACCSGKFCQSHLAHARC